MNYSQINHHNLKDEDMRNKILILGMMLVTNLLVFAQTPRGIRQRDNGYKSLWEDPKMIVYAALLIIGIIVTRKISMGAIKKRDKLAQKK